MQDAMNPDLPRPSELPPLFVVGAGKLGTAVAEAWERQGGTVALRISAGQEWQPEGLVFEATAPDVALGHLLRCAEARVPVVTGTTGWLDRLGELEGRLEAQKSTAFYSTNFSPGVHALKGPDQIQEEWRGREGPVPATAVCTRCHKSAKGTSKWPALAATTCAQVGNAARPVVAFSKDLHDFRRAGTGWRCTRCHRAVPSVQRAKARTQRCPVPRPPDRDGEEVKEAVAATRAASSFASSTMPPSLCLRGLEPIHGVPSCFCVRRSIAERPLQRSALRLPLVALPICPCPSASARS